MRSSKLLLGEDTVAFDGQFIQVIRRPFENIATGAQGMWWEMVRRKSHGRIVAIVALTPEHEVILVKIFRVPAKAWIIEACAGIMDKEGESEAQAAKRELLEETGYEVESVQEILSGPYNAGLISDEIVYFLGTNARKVREPELEDGEDIEVVKVSLEDVRSYLRDQGEGVKVDVKLHALIPLIENTLGR